MQKVGIYPGTFDPVTNGHVDIICRSSELFEKLIVAVANSSAKKPMFSLEERLEMIQLATKSFKNVECVSFNGLLAHFAKEHHCKVLVRGLRVVSDFEYELQMGYANKSLNNELETLYFMPTLQNAFISSSIVRSIIIHKGDASHLVPEEILEFIQRD
ncbi:pantetheine-phosphate adenylyltransferase [Helicobacter cetorum]|uniref:Phosphopantetheine adenylyltransferase n=1 Tax=Helicobacter cetorum (strain ATCC BAA-540 / CCUG 52418 / MIT 99-5656) TaxID=1163745 RepID=I0ESF8_HELCM|nr:pantetheine-phosphate adenylyltransferase [Helicobacter cetorum]AFI05877.1 phosphopantetheine adenylyltransferase [Helicobacter cetorum MIT 99-5656]